MFRLIDPRSSARGASAGGERIVSPQGGPGAALDEATRRDMEGFFGTDLGDVRIHADPGAAALASRLGAEALTIGRDIYFGEGRFDPMSRTGKALLGHELTHVIQQKGVPHRGAPPRHFAPGGSADAREREARGIAATFLFHAPRAGGDGFTVERYECAYTANRAPDEAERLRLQTIAERAFKICEEILTGRKAELSGGDRALEAVHLDVDLSLARMGDREMAQTWGRRMAEAVISAAHAKPDAVSPAPARGAMASPDDGKPAPATPTATTIDVKRSTFVVAGRTLAEAGAELDAREEWGRTTWSATYSYEATDGMVTSVSVTATIRVELPEWRELAKQSRRVQNEWNRMMMALGAHEETHVRIARERIDKLAGELLGKPEGDLAALYQKALADLQRLSDDYDDRTNRGETEGVMLALVAAARPKPRSSPDPLNAAEAEARSVEESLIAGMADRPGITSIDATRLQSKSTAQKIWDKVTGKKMSVQEVLEKSKDPDDIDLIETAALQTASADQKMALIQLILKTKGAPTDRLSLLWDVKPEIIGQNIDPWKQTWTEHAGAMAEHPFHHVFLQDVEDVARAMLTESEAIIQAYLAYYGPDGGTAGPNAADRDRSAKFVQRAAEDVAEAQTQLKTFRDTRILTGGKPGFVMFEPNHKPAYTTAESSKLYDSINKSYNEVTSAIDSYLDAVPELYPIVMTGSSSKQGAYEDPQTALAAVKNPQEEIRKSLRKTLDNIHESKGGILGTLARDRKLGPVEKQLTDGLRTADAQRNWNSNPVYAALVSSLTAPKGLGQTVAEMAVMLGVQIVLAAATGGVGNVLLGAAQATMSQAEARVLQKASDTSMSPSGAIVDKREVAAANLAAAMDAAFLVLDLLPGFKEARGVWRAARGEAQAAAAAAKEIEKKALELEAKLMAKAEKAQIEALEKSIEEEVARAEKAVTDAKAKAATAGDAERELVQIEVRHAEEALARARAIAESAKNPSERLAVEIGGRTYRWSRGLGLVICESPCEQALEKLGTKGDQLIKDAKAVSEIAAQEVQQRVNAVRQHLKGLDTTLGSKTMTEAELKRLAAHTDSLFKEIEAQKDFAVLRYGRDAAAATPDKWTNDVLAHLAARKKAIEEADTAFFTGDVRERVLKAREAEWRGKIAALEKEVRSAAADPNNRATVMKKLDDALANYEREIRGQRSLVLEGAEVKAFTDEEAAKILRPGATSKELRGKSKPDYVAIIPDPKGHPDGILVLGDSKGLANIDTAVKQLEGALESDFAKTFVKDKRVQCRVYLPFAQFTEQGYQAIGHPPTLHQFADGKFVPMMVKGEPLYVVFN